MRCTATKKDGTPCRTFAVKGTDPPRCLFHSKGNIPKEARGRGYRQKSLNLRKVIETEIRSTKRRAPGPERTRTILALLTKLEALGEIRPSEDWKTKVESWKKETSLPQ